MYVIGWGSGFEGESKERKKKMGFQGLRAQGSGYAWVVDVGVGGLAE